MPDSAMVALGPCWGCWKTFEFNPDTVVTILVDPVTQLAADAEGADPQRAVQVLVCDPCVTLANKERARRGLTLIVLASEMPV